MSQGEALEAIKRAAFDHMMIMEANKAEQSLEDTSSPKKFEAMILDENYEIVSVEKEVYHDGKTFRKMVKLVKKFDVPQQAQRWCDARLVEGSPDWTGQVYEFGKPYEEITRDNSFGRVFGRKTGAVCKTQKHDTSRLGFGVKAKQDHASFSKG